MKSILFLLLLGMTVTAVSAPVNRLKNSNFSAGKSHWSKPAYYNGTLEIASASEPGGPFARLKAGGSGDQAYGRFFQLVPLRMVPERLLTFRATVRGRGELRLGFLEYTRKGEGKITTSFRYSPAHTALSEPWRTVSFTFLLPDANTFQIAPFLEVRGENSVAEIRDPSLCAENRSGTLVFSPAHEILSGSAPLPELSAVYHNADGKSEKGCEIRWSDSGGRSGKKWTDDNGRIHFTPSELTSDVTKLLAVNPADGAVAELYFDRMPEAQFRDFRALADACAGKKPCRILVLGDSLSDFERGHNYLDKLAFFRNSRKPGSLTFRNAGVGGDYITRVVCRLDGLNGGAPAYRQEQYDGLWKDSYDRIFIFLGQNDTRTHSSDQFRKPRVSPVEQEDAYRKAIAAIRARSRARIVLVSSAMPDNARIALLEQKAKQAGRPFARFGEPARLEAFNAVLRKLAAELDCDYIDLHGAFQRVPDRSVFFSPADGVHLTEAGNRFVAGVLLNYFATEKE